MTNILLISGKKQSGKNTVSNFIHGYMMRARGVTKKFYIDEDNGKLHVYSRFVDGEGQEKFGMGELDILRTDPEFEQYASALIWPHVKNYYFADTLKEMCMRVFGIPPHKLYGTNEQKNEPTEIKWSDIAFALPPRIVGKLKKEGKFDQYMTGREFLQQFSTAICRKIKNTCWIDACYRDIIEDGSELAVVSDTRYPDEIECGLAIQKAGLANVKTLRLTRKGTDDDDQHSSEIALDGCDELFDAIVDNANMTIPETCDEVLRIMLEWGWLPVDVSE